MDDARAGVQSATVTPLQLEIDVTPNNSALPNDTQTVDLTAVSGMNASQFDEVVASTRVPGPLIPGSVTLSATPPSPELVGTNITLAASASGGFGPLLYQFTTLYPGSTTPTVVQDFSASSSCVWTPNQPTPLTGSGYTLTVNVKDSLMNTTASASLANYVVTANPLTAVSLSTNPTPSGVTHSPVVLTAVPNGGGDPQFLFFVGWRDASGAYQTQQLNADYSATATYSWTPITANLYYFQVECEDFANANPASTLVTSPRVPYSVGNAELTAVSLTANLPAPRAAGVSITLSANPNGGINDVYEFTATLAGSAQPIQNYSTSSTCTWTPTVPGNYTLGVNVKDLSITPPPVVTGTLNYQITGDLTGVIVARQSHPAADAAASAFHADGHAGWRYS